MGYVKNVWKDRNVERPNTYSEVVNDDGTKTFTPSPGVVTEAGTPITAEKMNNIEQGIFDALPRDEAIELLNHNAHDDYALWLELYYKGYVSQVEAASAKAIMFDGFLNTDNVLSATAELDTVSKAYRTPLTISGNVTVASLTAWAGQAGTVLPAALIDGNLTTSVLSGNLGPLASSPVYNGVFDIGSVKAIKGLGFYKSQNNTVISINYYNLEYSIDGVNWVSLQSGKASISSDGVAWFNLPLDLNYVNARYVRIAFYLRNDSGSNTWPYDIREIGFEAITPSNGVLNSKVKSLPFTTKRADIYLTRLKSPNAIVPRISFGSSFLPMTLLESYTSPRDSGYIEERYYVEGEGASLQAKIDFIVDPLYPKAMAQLKHYGVIIT